MVIPEMDHINKHLATAALSTDYPKAIKAALTIGKKTLNCYYNKNDHSENFQITMSTFSVFITFNHYLIFILFRSPSQHKLEYFEKAGWEEVWVTKAQEIVRTEFERSYKYSTDLEDFWDVNGTKSTMKVCYTIIFIQLLTKIAGEKLQEKNGETAKAAASAKNIFDDLPALKPPETTVLEDELERYLSTP